MLEPASIGENLYRRPREEGQKCVVDEDDPIVKDRHEIKNLIDRQEVRPRGRESRQKDSIVQYLVKWKNMGPAHNVWYNVEDLDKAKKLMEKYDTSHPCVRVSLMRNQEKTRNTPRR